MAYINSDQFNARGLWNPATSYKKADALKRPFADMVVWPVAVGIGAAQKVPGLFVALKDSTNQTPTYAGTIYWKLIRLNQ